VTVAWLTIEGLLGRRLITGFQGTTNPLYRLWRLVLPDDRLVPPGTVGLRALSYAALALLATWGWRSLAPRTRGAAGRRLPRRVVRAPLPIPEPDVLTR
jgi:hypothetical protein